ncbi:hypothetical protein KM043_010840 [Ampulex compressa]|nr:hypothetical protein KM043_010840 [Ampulex compressa]
MRICIEEWHRTESYREMIECASRNLRNAHRPSVLPTDDPLNLAIEDNQRCPPRILILKDSGASNKGEYYGVEPRKRIIGDFSCFIPVSRLCKVGERADAGGGEGGVAGGRKTSGRSKGAEHGIYNVLISRKI